MTKYARQIKLISEPGVDEEIWSKALSLDINGEGEIEIVEWPSDDGDPVVIGIYTFDDLIEGVFLGPNDDKKLILKVARLFSAAAIKLYGCIYDHEIEYEIPKSELLLLQIKVVIDSYLHRADADSLPREKWSPRMYGFEPDGGH